MSPGSYASAKLPAGLAQVSKTPLSQQGSHFCKGGQGAKQWLPPPPRTPRGWTAAFIRRAADGSHPAKQRLHPHGHGPTRRGPSHTVPRWWEVSQRFPTHQVATGSSFSGTLQEETGESRWQPKVMPKNTANKTQQSVRSFQR